MIDNQLELEGDNPEISNALDHHFTSNQAELKTSMPAKIVKYDKDKQWAQVQSLWKRFYLDEDGQEVEQEQAIINDVPIQFPRFGNFVILFPLKAGDSVWLQFAERAMESYLASDAKTIIDPVEGRMHDINDAYATPCFSTEKTAIMEVNDNFVIRSLNNDTYIALTPDQQVQIKASKVLLGSSTADKALALAEKVNNRFSSFENLYNAHIHVTPAGPSSPTVSLVVGSQNVDSSKVFTDA